jgi:hypothetical protein
MCCGKIFFNRKKFFGEKDDGGSTFVAVVSMGMQNCNLIFQ